MEIAIQVLNILVSVLPIVLDILNHFALTGKPLTKGRALARARSQGNKDDDAMMAAYYLARMIQKEEDND